MPNKHLLFRAFVRAFTQMQAQQRGSAPCSKSKTVETTTARRSDLVQPSQSAALINVRPDGCLEKYTRRVSVERTQNAEKVLGAFYAAVAEEYGCEEAVRAAQDWIEEAQKVAAAEYVDWRLVTITAARRLAERVTAPFHL